MISSGAGRPDHLSPRFSASAPAGPLGGRSWVQRAVSAPDDAQMLSHPFGLCVPDAMGTYPWLEKPEISPEISKRPPGQEREGGTGMPGPTIPSSASGNTSSEEGRGNIRAAWRKTQWTQNAVVHPPQGRDFRSQFWELNVKSLSHVRLFT